MPETNALTMREVMTVVNQYIGVSGGYLADFSYRTHREFYPEYCDLEIDPEASEYSGTTRERFIQILSSRPPGEQAAILRGVLERFGASDTSDDAQRWRARTSIEQWAARADGASPVRIENPLQTRAVVLRALNDADRLMSSSGATSVVDRVHTALHGHLHAICEAARIDVDAEATLNGLLRALRTNHPALQPTGPRAEDITRVLQSTGAILDALNPIRNRASVAHPNRELLDDAEATLVVNAARTVFTYVDAKVR